MSRTIRKSEQFGKGRWTHPKTGRDHKVNGGGTFQELRVSIVGDSIAIKASNHESRYYKTFKRRAERKALNTATRNMIG